jgi:long-chain acyl-CoA synthetase
VILLYNQTFYIHLLSGIYRKNSIYDKLVFDKIRASTFGGRIVRSAIGSAPLSDEVMLFARAVLGCPLTECYGQTEATCVISSQHPLDPKVGHCGSPFAFNMVKLNDVKIISILKTKN